MKVAENSAKKHRILVVDDERMNIDALTYILKPTYTVSIAKNGQTALDIAKTYVPDLILLDIVMPDMTGFEVLAALKSSDLTRAIPVIFISGQDRADFETRGISLGAIDYITKPFSNTSVLSSVKTHLHMLESIRAGERKSMINALINLSNRNGFEKRLADEWAESSRLSRFISLLLVAAEGADDADDVYTQIEVILHTAAAILEQTLNRPLDTAILRKSGDFAVLLPDTAVDTAQQLAERIRNRIENVVIFGSNTAPLKITAHIGVNSEKPSGKDSVQSFIDKAERALCKSKINNEQ